MNRSLTVLAVALLFGTMHAQQVDWMTSSPVDYTMNPGMPRHTLASAPGRLVAARMVDVHFIYGITPYGPVALDALDPATGGTLLSCLLLDSVSIRAAVVDPAGIAYIAGRFMGDVLEFCDGSQLPGIGGTLFTENHFLLAWDLTSGAPLWMRNLSTTYPQCEDVPSLALDPEGHLWYIMQDFSDGRLVRVDGEGNDVEAREISGIRRFGTISFDPWGGAYVSGSCENGTLTFGGQGFPVESDQGYNMFLLRYKPDGTPGFAEFAADATFQDPTVVATSDGHAYLAGVLMQPEASWGGLPFTGSNWGSDLFLVKVDSMGQFLWNVESNPMTDVITGDMERAAGPCITVDASDNVYLMGAIRGVVDWGNGVVSDGQIISQRSLTVVAFDPSGMPQWAVTSEPSAWYVAAQNATVMAVPGSVHFIGHAADPFTMGPFTVGGEGQQSVVLGRITEVTTGLEAVEASTGLQSWPNPMAEVLHVQGLSAGMGLELRDALGRLIWQGQADSDRLTIATGDLPIGSYLLRTDRGDVLRLVR
ncbi:MAG TPA: hypothetical protein PLN54_03805 [Flavobacteriales bacterium]|nr:hypothetical protein [Flavobacteriales bacterium]